jgi:hypothetical protein
MKKYLILLTLLVVNIINAQDKTFFNDKIKGDIGYSLSKISYLDTDDTLQEYYRNSLKINLNINLWRDFYIKNTFYVDFNKSDVEPTWLSDYFYQIGNYNWRNKTFSYGYENYQPNKWDNFADDFFTNLKRGYFFGSYKYEITKPEKKESFKILFWDKTSKIELSPILKIHPEYADEFNEFAGNFKPILALNIRYVIIKNIYIEAGLFYYPVQESKLPWDPDYTYGFGIFDYRKFKINFSYGNWIANRFTWNTKELDHHGFLNGEFTLNFTYKL